MAKLERLLNLMAVLLEADRPLSAAELRARVPGYPDEKASFQRAFERDKDDLREMGVPLEVGPVPGRYPEETGYRVRKDQYYLRDPGFERDELAALQLAAASVQLEGLPGAQALWKLGGADEADRGDGAVQVQAPSADARLATAFQAVVERRALHFRYREEDRDVDPYRLDFQRGRWYLTGFDHLRGEERVYRLDRVEGDVVAGTEADAFQRPEGSVPGLRLEPWQLGEGEPVRARLLVDAVQAGPARSAAAGATVVEERPDGSIVLELEVTHRAGFRSFVLGFLEHAEVLSPPDVREEVVTWLDQLAAG